METKGRRTRRQFTEEFKAGAVRLVLDEGKTVAQVARDLDLTESALRTWVERARADRGKGKPGVLTRIGERSRARLVGTHPRDAAKLARSMLLVAFAMLLLTTPGRATADHDGSLGRVSARKRPHLSEPTI